MSTIVSQITSLTIVCSTVYSGADQRKRQSSASLAFVRGIHRRPVNSPHKGPVTWKMLPLDDAIMRIGDIHTSEPGMVCIIGHPSEMYLKFKSREISFVQNIRFNNPIVLKFCTELKGSLPCSEQNFTMIGQLKQMLRTNEISRALSLRWFSDGYPILHKVPGRGWQVSPSKEQLLSSFFNKTFWTFNTIKCISFFNH